MEKIDCVDNELLQEVVRRIVNSVHPERIILFGSYAYGEPEGESDLDLLVIMNSELPRYKRAVSIYSCLTGILLPKDIVVYTPEEVKEWSEVPQAFITTVIKKGKVIYEKEQA